MAAQLLSFNPTAAAQVRLTDVTEAAGITFRHVASPDKKYIVESMSGGVALFDYDGDGLARPLPRQLAHGRSRQVRRQDAQRALPQQRRRHIQGRDRPRRCQPTWAGAWASRPATTTTTAARPLRHLPRPQPPLPQQRRRHFRGRDGEGRRRRPALVNGRGLRRLRQRRAPRPLRRQLRRLPARPPARVRQGQDLPVQGHRRAVRPARPARRGRLALPQQRRRHLHRRLEEGRRRRPARASTAWASSAPTSTRTG